MFEVVLIAPEIPPNTGNIIRLCANTGARLHLVEPLGFRLDDRELRRAGLDYHEYVRVRCHASYADFLTCAAPARVFAFSTRGDRNHAEIAYRPDDALVFGAETRGLPPAVRADFGSEQLVRIPMLAHSRSLNLGNAVAVVVYEAWRQQGFAGARDHPRD